MKVFACYIIVLFHLFGINAEAQNVGQEYIEKWQAFYPSRALAEGMHSAIFDYENRSKGSIDSWIKYNQKTLTQLSDTDSRYKQEYPIDSRLLRVQLQSELNKWLGEKPHQNSLAIYASLIANSMDKVLESTFLTGPEKSRLVCERLADVERLSTSALSTLSSVDNDDGSRSLKRLTHTLSFLQKELPELINSKIKGPVCSNFESHRLAAIKSLEGLISYTNTTLLPQARESNSILGRAEYARRLALYTDSDLTPEALLKMAEAEIEKVRNLIGEVSRTYLESQYPNNKIPKKYDDIVTTALADMGKDVPKNGADYLAFWEELSEKAVIFIEEKEIATLPKNQTLQILPAPESAGAAARIGWVASAPPFEPNPLTTLYLPSIPESLPVQERIDFWSSFNKPFNRMIVIHELFPGHYMQMKISRETPHPIRLLFPYGIYTEGWATFCERVVLDAGWDADDQMTMLAHLRKRLENANRAYTSVQVHCNGWNKDQVMDFSTSTSLVAPQFAKSLWGRLMRSPMQLTSYFLGGAQFTELLAYEKERLGTQFVLKEFMDTIMLAGPIPIDEFKKMFATTILDK